MEYKHFAEKTPYEKYMLANVTCHVEETLPSYWSANTITIIGNSLLFVSFGLAFYFGGVSYTDENGNGVEALPSWVLFFIAFSVQWFSWFDMMDG